MKFDQQSLDYIAEIYDLALEPDLWPERLEKYIGFFVAAAASLHTFDPIYRNHQLTVLTSLYNEPFFESYRDRYVEFDRPAFDRLLRLPNRGYVSDFDLLGITPEEQALHPPVVHLKKTFGVRHRAATRLNLHGAWHDVLAVQFDQSRGPITDAEASTGNFFLPHFAKVVEINRPFVVLRSRFQAVMAVLDRFHVGVFILSSTGHTILRNREADRILDLEDGLSLDRSGQPQPAHETERRELHDAILKAAATARAEGDRAETLLALPRISGGDPFLAEVAPIRASGVELDSGFTGAMMLVIDPMHTDVVSTEGMQALYNLTGAESDTCRLIAEGLGTGDIADTQNLTLETVRTYVKRILEKTGTKNRVQLVRLALTVNLPIDELDGRADENE